MKLFQFVFGVLSVVVASGLCAKEGERVAGAQLIEEARQLEEVLLDVVAQPLTQGEVDLLVADAPVVLDWADANSDLWLSAERTDDPVSLIKTFEVWGNVDIRYSEFMAVVSKLMFMEEMGSGDVDVDGMKQELATMKGFISSGDVPEEALAQVGGMVKDMEKMLYLMESVVPRCRDVFEKNREAVVPLLERLQAIQD